MKLLFGAFGFALMIMPSAVFASVVINEVAWMGTPQAANDEWIELKNTGSENISLKGWMLTASDGTPLIKLTGTSTAGGFFLLERTNDDSVAGVVADQIYTGALSNSGEDLTLKDALGVAVDIVKAAAGWPAGDNDTKKTMQRSGTQWITAQGTPRAQNAIVAKSIATEPPPPPVKKIVSSSTGDPGAKTGENANEVETKTPVSQDRTSSYYWLFLSIAAGLLLGFWAVLLKKKFAKGQDEV